METTQTSQIMAWQLEAGDYITRIGGKSEGRNFKRYAMKVTVVDVFRAPKARTRIDLKVRFDNGAEAHYKLRAEYPVEVGTKPAPAKPTAAGATRLAERAARIARMQAGA